MSNNQELLGALEAILTVAEMPINLITLAGALESPVPEVRAALEALREDYDAAHDGRGRGFEIREVGGGWRLYVRQEHDWAVKSLVANENPSKLSQAALETLAVIAYRQPVSRGQVSAIRGVSVDGVVRTLLSRGLVVELYTDGETGAVMFGTSEQLLEHLGINSMDELPAISPYLPGQDDIGE